MAMIEGTAHTTKRYALSDFSDRAWESDGKTRHVNELTKKVEEAQRNLDAAELR